MDWRINVIHVALWALLLVFCNFIVYTYQSEITQPNHDGCTKVKKHSKRSRDLLLDKKKGHFSSNDKHEELMKNIQNVLDKSEMFMKSADVVKGRQQGLVTYDDLKTVFRTYLYQHLKLISPNIIKYARQARGKKKKYQKFILPMIMGAILVKSLILPIVLKGLAVLSSKAVMLSMISLLVASLSSLKRSARNDSEKTEVQVIHVPVKHGGYKRYDDDHDEHTHEDYYHDDYGHHHHDRNDVPYYRRSMHPHDHERTAVQPPNLVKGVRRRR